MAVAFDAVGPSSSGAGNTGATTLSWTHTAVASGVTLVVGVSVGKSPDTGLSVAVTCDGNTMTALTGAIHAAGTTTGFIAVFGLPNQASGGHSIVATVSGGTPTSISGGSASFSGADTSSPFGTPVTATGNGTSASATITASSSTSQIVAVVGDGSGSATGWGATATREWANNVSSGSGCGNNEGAVVAATGSSQTLTDTIGSDNWAIALTEIKAPSGGPAPAPIVPPPVTPPGRWSPMAARRFRMPPPLPALAPPFSITSTFGTATDGGLLRVIALTGATEAGGAIAGSNATSGAASSTITPNGTNSYVVYVNDYDNTGTTATFLANTTAIDNLAVGAVGEYTGFFNGTVTSGVTTAAIGVSAPTGTNAWSLYEVLASGGSTPVQDAVHQPASGASASSGTSLTVTTRPGSFAPGTVLVAMIVWDQGSGTPATPAITDTSGLGLTWTLQNHQSRSQTSSWIYTATIPGGSSVIPGAASLSGSGTLSDSGETITAPASLSGSGTLSAIATITAPASLSGSGTLSTVVKITAPASLSGSGTLSDSAGVPGAASLSGSGTLSAVATITAPAALSGSGTLSAVATITAVVSLSGSGTLSTAAKITAPASLSGSGTMATAVTVTAPAALSGSGTMTTAVTVTAPAALLGSGTLSTHVTVTAPASLSGSGTLSAVATITAAASLSGSGAITAVGASSGLRPPENLGATCIPVTIDGAATVPDYGGTAGTVANTYGGGVTAVDAGDAVCTPVTIDATATTLANTYGGTLTLANYGAALIGWTMQTAALTLAENNDETVSVAITQNGSPLNLTGATVNMYLKTAAGTADGSALLLSSAGGSPAITITSPTGGLCSVAIPRADLYPETYTFYRIDVVFSGLQNTVVYGAITWITL